MRPCVQRFAEQIDAIMPTKFDHTTMNRDDMLDMLDTHVCDMDGSVDQEHQDALVRVARDCMMAWDNKELGRYG